MSKPWKGRHPSRHKDPHVPSWLAATFEESSESAFSGWFYLVTVSRREPQLHYPPPDWIHRGNTIHLDCKSGAGDQEHFTKPTEGKSCSAAMDGQHSGGGGGQS